VKLENDRAITECIVSISILFSSH